MDDAISPAHEPAAGRRSERSRAYIADAVRSAMDLDAPLGQLGMTLADVGHEEVQDRAGAPLLLADGVQVEPDPAAVEEDEIAEGEDVRELEHIAIPGLGRGRGSGVHRDLSKRAQLQRAASGGGCAAGARRVPP